MKKSDKIFWTLVTLAEIGIIIFWIAGFNKCENIAMTAFLSSGILCWVALGVKFFARCRHRNLYGY